jgi:two-component system response regulator LytT
MNKCSTILIVEDEAIIAEELKNIVQKIGHRVSGVVYGYSEAIEHLKHEVPDLVLLDIGLNYSEHDGIDLAGYINTVYKIPFIYITANSDRYTIQRAKLTEPSAFILKPFNQENIFSNIEIVLHKHNEISYPAKITVTSGSKKVTIDCRNIVFLKADNMYTEIYTADNKKYVVRNYLKNILAELPPDIFAQVHRSYVVNLGFVESHTAEHIFVQNDKIPIGSAYKNRIGG